MLLVGPPAVRPYYYCPECIRNRRKGSVIFQSLVIRRPLRFLPLHLQEKQLIEELTSENDLWAVRSSRRDHSWWCADLRKLKHTKTNRRMTTLYSKFKQNTNVSEAPVQCLIMNSHSSYYNRSIEKNVPLDTKKSQTSSYGLSIM